MSPKEDRGGAEFTSLRTIQLALQSSRVLDIPPKTRFLLLIAGVAGIGLVVMGSLSSGGQSIPTDKIVHFAGYSTLAFVFVMALRPILYVPGLIGLAAIGMAVEVLQRQTGRSFDLMDELANCTGIAVGALVGLVARALFTWVKTELALSAIRKELRHYESGDVLFEEGDRVDTFLIVKSGLVRLVRTEGSSEKQVGACGPGDVVGAVGAVLGRPASATAVASLPTSVFPIEARALLERAGDDEQPVATVLRALARRAAEGRAAAE